MRFQFFNAFGVADTVDRLSLKASVDEVGRPLAPPVRYPVLFNLNLPAEDLIADILASAAFVGSLTHHALVRDHAHCKVICGESVVLPTHHFRRHVAWRSTRLTRVVWRENASHTEVSQSQIALVVKN